MDITLDCETWLLDHHNPEFKVLFDAWMYDAWNGRKFHYRCDPGFCFNTTDVIIGHNVKFDLKCIATKQYSYDWCKLYDTQIAVHLLREDLPQEKGHGYYKLESLAHIFYQYPNYKYLVNFDDPDYPNDLETLKLYNKHDLLFTKQLKDLTEPALKRSGKWPLFQMMMEYVKHLTRLEMRGVKVDLNELNRQGAIWTAKRNKLIEQLQNYGLDASVEMDAGVGRNEIIDYFRKQGVELPKTEKGNDQANEQALKIIASDSIKEPATIVAGLLLELREANKQLGTYIEGFRSKTYDGYYYPDYSLIATVTGRLSEHFIQVMPRKETSEFKKCIISKFPGGYLLANDWSRLEAMLAAEMFWIFTGKHKLADDLQSGYDIHDETLKRFKFLPDRTRAKNANFSTIFGGKGWTLVNEYGFTWPQAKEFVNDLTVIRYPEMSEFFNMRAVEIINKGYVEHPYTKRGRHTTNYNEGLNAPIQGIGTDYNKIMLIVLSEALQDYESHPLIDVHDDLVIDTHPDEKEEVIQIVKKEYGRFNEHFYRFFGVELKIKYMAEHKIGQNLYDMTKIVN